MPSMRTQQGKRHDPFRKFQFTLHTEAILGTSPAWTLPRDSPVSFTEVSGLRSETELVEYKEGHLVYGRKMPGRTTFDNISCSRGMDPNGVLQNWRNTVIEGSMDPLGKQGDEHLRQNLVISLYDRRGKENNLLLKQWKCYEAFPVSYEIEDLSGGSSDVLVERVEFAIEWWELVTSTAHGVAYADD